jgi:uncharacterized protein YbcI
MASAQDSIRPDSPSGTQLAALSDALVKLHTDTCGRGPTNARCFASGDVVVCLLFGGLTRAEQTLIASGGGPAVITHRESLYGVMEPEARALVEDQLGRRVTAMTMATDPANELETVVFVLDAPPDL